jgi:DNA-binding GntR family transcriptional regulator
MKRSISGLNHKRTVPGLVKPVSLTDQVSDVIKQLILSGDLKPGDRVVEQKVARQLGVGQNAVREALIELTHMGYVRRVPNIGTFVTQLSRSDAEKISQVRSALETLVVDLVAQRSQSSTLDFSQAQDLLRKMRKAAGRADVAAFYDYDLQFHRILWTLADNEHLSQLLEQIVVPLFAFFLIVKNPVERADYLLEAVDHHEHVVQALVSHAPQKAHAAICGLMELSLRQQRDIISEKPLAANKNDASPDKESIRS